MFPNIHLGSLNLNVITMIKVGSRVEYVGPSCLGCGLIHLLEGTLPKLNTPYYISAIDNSKPNVFVCVEEFGNERYHIEDWRELEDDIPAEIKEILNSPLPVVLPEEIEEYALQD